MDCDEVVESLAGTHLSPIEHRLQVALVASRREVFEAQAENLRLRQRGDFLQLENAVLRETNDKIVGGLQGVGARKNLLVTHDLASLAGSGPL